MIRNQQQVFHQIKQKKTNSLPLGTSTLHTGDTSHGTSSSPGLGTSLVTNINVDSIGLPLVLRDVVVDPGHDVWPHWGPEHSRQAHGTA